jgi:thiamine kinase-like enzyme
MEIASFVPSLVHQYFNQEHLVLSLEYIHGRKAQFSDLEKIKKISPNFHNLKYLQLKSSMTRKVFYFMIKNSRTTEKLSIKYTSDLISEIELRAEKKFPSQNIKQDILLLKSLFLKKNILMKLNIKRDLVLQHRELNPSHLRIDFNKDLKIIDWELYGLDFPGSDILNFILSFTIDFELIKTEVFDYLKSQNISNVELICNHLTLRYIGILLNNVEGTRIQENWSHAIDYLKKSPLYN